MLEPSSREWIRNPHRNEEEYKEGVRNFITFVKNHSPHDVSLCVCPCVKCINSKKFPLETVEKHLIIFGMNPSYNEWFFHGERNDAIMRMNPTPKPTQGSSSLYKIQVEDCVNGPLENLINDAFTANDISQASNKENPEEPNVSNGDNSSSLFDHRKKYNEFKSKASEKLYPFCEDGLTKLSIIIELHNLKKGFNWSGNSMTELLKRMKLSHNEENVERFRYEGKLHTCM